MAKYILIGRVCHLENHIVDLSVKSGSWAWVDSINQVNWGWDQTLHVQHLLPPFLPWSWGSAKFRSTHRKYNNPKTEAFYKTDFCISQIFLRKIWEMYNLWNIQCFWGKYEKCTAHSNNGKTWKFLQSFHLPDKTYWSQIHTNPTIYHFKIQKRKTDVLSYYVWEVSYIWLSD